MNLVTIENQWPWVLLLDILIEPNLAQDCLMSEDLVTLLSFFFSFFPFFLLVSYTYTPGGT
jgi:hypothetical protein